MRYVKIIKLKDIIIRASTDKEITITKKGDENGNKKN